SCLDKGQVPNRLNLPHDVIPNTDGHPHECESGQDGRPVLPGQAFEGWTVLIRRPNLPHPFASSGSKISPKSRLTRHQSNQHVELASEFLRSRGQTLHGRPVKTEHNCQLGGGTKETDRSNVHPSPGRHSHLLTDTSTFFRRRIHRNQKQLYKL